MFSSNDHQLNQCPAVPIMEIDGRWKAHVQQAPNCPRCASTNTKFCYYNNYSLAQPRYYCKACKRYWTKGGSLRNVPVGGGCRKTRRSRAKANSSSHNSADVIPFPPQTNAPEIDLAAVFARYVNQDSGLPSPSVSVTEQDVEMVTHNIDQNQYLFDDLQSFDHGLLQTEDVFWSTSEDGSSLSSSGFAAWDPVAHQEELDSSPLELYGSVLDDQFGVSTSSLLSDINWSCFDQAGYLD